MKLTFNEKLILGASAVAAIASIYYGYKYFTELADQPVALPPPSRPVSKAKAKPSLGHSVAVPPELRERVEEMEKAQREPEGLSPRVAT